MESQLIELLLQQGNSTKSQGIHQTALTGEKMFEEAFKDVNKYPHIFVLGCIGDKKIGAERAWKIPIAVAQKIQSLKFEDFSQLSESDLISIFSAGKLHFYNNDTAKQYYRGIQRIAHHYDGDASKIWNRNPSSSLLVRRFLEFEGVGVKIATMAANILTRDYKISVKDKTCIDISPDTHVMRVFKRTGLVRPNEKKEAMMYKAREISPGYPGILDFPMFEIGRNVCFAKKIPNCTNCILNEFCPKVGVISHT